MKRILVPTDFSKESENAIQTAIPIAQAFNATIVLLHVLEVSSLESFGDEDNKTSKEEVYDAVKINDCLKEAQESFDRSSTLHALDQLDLSMEQFIRIGNPIKQIEESIVEDKIDFVIMGAKAPIGLNDMLLGTTTDKLLRKVSCPVLSVNEVVPAEAFSSIVLPTTTYNQEQALIDVVKKFQQAFNSKIFLVRINTPKHFLSANESLALLEEYALQNNLNMYESYVYSHTDEEDGIREFAESVKGGVIAMSTSAHTGLWKIIQGSVAKELVGNSKRPVLTVKMG